MFDKLLEFYRIMCTGCCLSGTNILGFRGSHLLTNLSLHEFVEKSVALVQLCNETNQEITSPGVIKFWVANEHWSLKIKIIQKLIPTSLKYSISFPF